MLQYIAGNPLDLLTKDELAAAMATNVDDVVRAELRGIKNIRITKASIGTTDGSGNLAEAVIADATPEQGYVWSIRRISSGVGGTVYVNGTPTIPINQITLAASGVAAYNNNSIGVNQTISGGTVSAIAINGTATGLTSGTFFVPAGGTVTVTYTVAPTTFTTAAAPVQQLNTSAIDIFWGGPGSASLPARNVASFNPARPNVGKVDFSRGEWILNAGESVVISGTALPANTQVSLEIQALEVPAEMVGKIVT